MYQELLEEPTYRHFAAQWQALWTCSKGGLVPSPPPSWRLTSYLTPDICDLIFWLQIEGIMIFCYIEIDCTSKLFAYHSITNSDLLKFRGLIWIELKAETVSLWHANTSSPLRRARKSKRNSMFVLFPFGILFKSSAICFDLLMSSFSAFAATHSLETELSRVVEAWMEFGGSVSPKDFLIFVFEMFDLEL